MKKPLYTDEQNYQRYNKQRIYTVENQEKCYYGKKEKLKQYLSDVREVKALNRELACLLIEKVVIYPIDAAENTRKIEIDWKF